MRSERQSVFIFPEGTRSYSLEPDLLPFKKGAFHLAVQAQVPIVPIVAANYSNVLTMKGAPKGWFFTSGRIPVRVLKPIPTEGLKADAVDGLAKECRERMLLTLREMGGAEKQSNGFATSSSIETRSGKKLSQMPI